MPAHIQLQTPPYPFGGVPAESNEFLKKRLGTQTIEAMSDLPPVFAQTFCHPVVEAAYLSFAKHIPLSLRPDDFWLMISQGFAKHITLNAEKLRSRFVAHEGQITLAVVRNEFKRGDRHNDWPGVFTEFSGQIAHHIGETQKLFVPNFSTTTPTDTAAFEIVLMDAMSAYFCYEVHTKCGIPSVRLEGEKSDWEMVLDHTQSLATIDPDLSWWTERVIDDMAAIIACFDQPNPLFWTSFFKERSMSGGPMITGWILDFFPYIETRRDTTRHLFQSTGFPSLPSGLSSVPFIWNYFGEVLEMKFVAGHLGVVHQDGHLSPITGWAVQNTRD